MAQHTYTIYFSARDASGKMWCPDCRLVEPTVSATFDESKADGPQASIVWLDRADWKSPANKYRHAPWNLTAVPSILKFDSEGEIVARLGNEDEILNREKLEKFLKAGELGSGW